MSVSASPQLPRLTPRSTFVTAERPKQRPKVISAEQMMKAYSVYPPRLPSAPEGPMRRINVLRPEPPKRFTHMLETAEPHYHNEKRANRMKQREHYRYHNAWSKYYYGTPSDQESYRSYVRSVLKQQMTDRDAALRQEFVDKLQESVIVSERDRCDRQEDADKFNKRFSLLKSYRDENKQMMETLWDERKVHKLAEDRFDREQMRYNPINWSMTLK